jgi:hypothetical protein
MNDTERRVDVSADLAPRMLRRNRWHEMIESDAMDWRLDLGKIDPEHPGASKQYQKVLRDVVTQSRLTLRDIEKRSAKNASRGIGESRSIGSISENLKKESLSTGKSVESLLHAIDFSPDDVDDWLDVHAEIRSAVLRRVGPITPQIELLQDEINKLRKHADELEKQKRDLEKDLAAEMEARTRLAQEIDVLRQELDAALRRADGLERDLQVQLAAKEQEQSRVDSHIGELRAGLQIVTYECESTVSICNSLQVQVDNLAEAGESVDAALELERQRREQTEADMATLKARFGQLEDLLTRYQSEAVDASPQDTAVDIIPATNKNIEVELVISDKDFGQVRHIPLDFPWYCRNCDRGGERTYKVCPHCDRSVIHGFRTKLRVSIPNEPCYGSKVWLQERGYHDALTKAAGDVGVRFVGK